MSFAWPPRSRLLILSLIAAAALAGGLLAARAARETTVSKATCAPGFVRAEADLAERYERGKNGEGKRERERETGGAGIRHSDKYCMNINHPEMPEDIAKFGEAAALRFGGERPGQMRRALRQKARISDSTTIAGANGTWQPLGKGPLVANDPTYPFTYGDAFGVLAGRISDYAYDAGTNRLSATVAQGGVWESTDRGNKWFAISDGPKGLPIQSSGGIGWTPAGGGGGTLIVLTGDHAFSNDYSGMGAYWTTDDGATWHHASGLPDGALSFQIAIDPTNPKRVFAATGLGLFRSDDAGRSFENVSLPTGDCAGDSSKPNCFFANVVTSVQVQSADSLGHKGGAVAAAVAGEPAPTRTSTASRRLRRTASTRPTPARPAASRGSVTTRASRPRPSSVAPSWGPRRARSRTRTTSTRSSRTRSSSPTATTSATRTPQRATR